MAGVTAYANALARTIIVIRLVRAIICILQNIVVRDD